MRCGGCRRVGAAEPGGVVMTWTDAKIAAASRRWRRQRRRRSGLDWGRIDLVVRLLGAALGAVLTLWLWWSMLGRLERIEQGQRVEVAEKLPRLWPQDEGGNLRPDDVAGSGLKPGIPSAGDSDENITTALKALDTLLRSGNLSASHAHAHSHEQRDAAAGPGRENSARLLSRLCGGPGGLIGEPGSSIGAYNPNSGPEPDSVIPPDVGWNALRITVQLASIWLAGASRKGRPDGDERGET